jgi:hypothetical protein
MDASEEVRLLAQIRQAYADLLACIPFQSTAAGAGAGTRLKDMTSWLTTFSEPGVSIGGLQPMLMSLRELLPELARQPSPPALAPKAKVLLALIDEALGTPTDEADGSR